jgi:hypothetical protein
MDVQKYINSLIKKIPNMDIDKEKILIDVFPDLELQEEALKNLKILVLNTACNGFGDIIFSMKIFLILKDWFPTLNIKIASTKPDLFIQLGSQKEDLIKLKGIGSDQCIKFERMYFVDDNNKTLLSNPKFDLIFVAPLTIDFDIAYEDIKKLIPYSDKYNTFYFSEYNDRLDKGFDFNMGIGGDRLGLLFLDKGSKLKIPDLNQNYVVVYIAENVEGSLKCFENFVNMVTLKYHNIYNNFDIVIPSWIGTKIEKGEFKYLIKNISKYYDNISLITKDKNIQLLQNGNDKLNFRADIFPLSYDKMRGLFMHSKRDVLVTGDQSITDVLACCWKDKLPFYQIVPWKIDFATNLSYFLPQIFLENQETSCGSESAINYYPNFEYFMNEWNFKSNSKQKIYTIIKFAIERKKNKTLQNIIDIFFGNVNKKEIIYRLMEYQKFLYNKDKFLYDNACNNNPIKNIGQYINESEENVLFIIKMNDNFQVDCISKNDLNCNQYFSFGNIKLDCIQLKKIKNTNHSIFYLEKNEQTNKYNIEICENPECFKKIFKF